MKAGNAIIITDLSNLRVHRMKIFFSNAAR